MRRWMRGVGLAADALDVAVVDGGEVVGERFPFAQEEVVALLHVEQIEQFRDHDVPADDGHDAEDPDDDPAVDGDGLEDDAEEAEGAAEPAGGRGFVRAGVEDPGGVGALLDGGELDEAGAAGGLGDVELVDLADEGGVAGGGGGVVGADAGRRS